MHKVYELRQLPRSRLQAGRGSAEVGAQQVQAARHAVDGGIVRSQRQARAAVVDAQRRRAAPREVHRVAAHAAEGVDD
jgi:hypothetical protein